MSGADIDGVPTLSAADLKGALQDAYRARRQHQLTAWFGTAAEQTVVVDNVEIRVVPVRSELELRDQLPPPSTSDDARIAFLVPFTHDVPLDLAGRFAFTGRVKRIGPEARLRTLFGGGDVDDDVRRSPLASWLLRPGTASSVSADAPGSARYAIGESRVTMDALWSAWLRVDWQLDTDGGLALDALLAFAATDTRGPAFVTTMKDPAAGTTRALLLLWLHKTLGAAGPVVWRAWEEGRGRRAFELAFLFEPLARNPNDLVRGWLRAKAKDQLHIDKDSDVAVVVEALGASVGSAVGLLEQRMSVPELRALARAADDLVADEEVRTRLLESTRLPSAWTLRLDRLGGLLVTGLATRAVDDVNNAARALRALEGHAFFQDEEEAPKLKRAEMAVRLLAWLVARGDQGIHPGQSSYGDVEALGRWYAEEGGYVDRARRAARCTVDSPFTAGVQAVVVAADAARAVLDRRFARALASWVDAGQPSTSVLPIQDAVKRIAVRFLDGNPERRLLVLLLDGMAWAQAVELLESMGTRAAAWGPLAWHSAKDNRIGDAAVPVVLAALPTVTEVSRSSFFAGRSFGPGAKTTTSDVDHWAGNAAVKKHVPATDVPRLLLKGEGHTKAGGASNEALSLVESPDRRIVALVLNAIDDSLKGGSGTVPRWEVNDIASLPELLDKARLHGRSVLLASDHGHVPADLLQRIVDTHGPVQAARWRKWMSVDEVLRDDEVGFAGPRVCTPPGAHGVVLLADDATTYTPNTHAGEHGGASLAEVVAPCLLIGCADRLDPTNDRALDVRATLVPRWWYFDVSDDVVVDEPKVIAKKAPTTAPLLDLIVAAPLPTATTTTTKPAALPPTAFGTSAVLKAKVTIASERQKVVDAVELLVSRQGVMSAQAFTASLREMPYRIGGLVAKLQEVLNLDGYEVLRFDPVSRQVHLDRDKLAQLFEVEL